MTLNPGITYYAGIDAGFAGSADPAARIMVVGANTGTLYESINAGSWTSLGAPAGTAGGSPIYAQTGAGAGAYMLMLNGGLMYAPVTPGSTAGAWEQGGPYAMPAELSQSSRIDGGWLFFDVPGDEVALLDGGHCVGDAGENSCFVGNPNLAAGVVAVYAWEGPGVIDRIIFPPDGGSDPVHNATTTGVSNIMSDGGSDAYAFLLQDIAGPPLAEFNQTMLIDPESSNKTTMLTYAYDVLANGLPGNPTGNPTSAVDLVAPMDTYYEGLMCESDNPNYGSQSLMSALWPMIKVSSNNNTNNLINFFDNTLPGSGGDEYTPAYNVNDWYATLGAQYISPSVGPLFPEYCGTEINDLWDFGHMFSSVIFGGILSHGWSNALPDTNQGTLAGWMQTLNNKMDSRSTEPNVVGWSTFTSLITQEAENVNPSLLLPNGDGGIQSFMDQLNIGGKGGSNPISTSWMSWVEVPFCMARGADANLMMAQPDGGGLVVRRRYFLGESEDGGPSLTSIPPAMLQTQIRDALSTWSACVQ